MMNLYLWFVLMLVMSSAWLVWFLYRPLKNNVLDLEKSNIALGKQKQAELEQDLQRELIDESVFEDAKDEIAQVLAVEMMQIATTTTVETQKPIPIWLAVLIVTALSITSLGVYQTLTSQSITSQNATTIQTEKPPTLAQSIVNIRKRLAEQPDDAKSWRLLGLALFDSNQLSESLEAYEKSYRLNPKNEIMLVEYASTLAKSQGNQFKGRVSTLVREALEVNQNNVDALYLAGWVAINAQRLELTQMLWQRALSLLPENQADRMTLQRMLNELAQMRNADGKSTTTQNKPIAQHQVTIKIALSERLHQAEFKDYYLMVYVKAAQGRPMPIAIQKIKLKDFSGVVILTDKNSVMPTQQLSQASKVLAVARLSKSGSAIRQAGDIEAVSQVTEVKNNPTINLKLK